MVPIKTNIIDPQELTIDPGQYMWPPGFFKMKNPYVVDFDSRGYIVMRGVQLFIPELAIIFNTKELPVLYAESESGTMISTESLFQIYKRGYETGFNAFSQELDYYIKNDRLWKQFFVNHFKLVEERASWFTKDISENIFWLLGSFAGSYSIMKGRYDEDPELREIVKRDTNSHKEDKIYLKWPKISDEDIESFEGSIREDQMPLFKKLLKGNKINEYIEFDGNTSTLAYYFAGKLDAQKYDKKEAIQWVVDHFRYFNSGTGNYKNMNRYSIEDQFYNRKAPPKKTIE